MDNPNIYNFTFNELNISKSNILKAMGYGNGESEVISEEELEETLSEAAEYCDIKGGYRIIEDVSYSSDDMVLMAQNCNFAVGKIVGNLLRKANRVAVFSCTAGEGIGLKSKECMANGDLMKGYILDTIGSEVVEKAMDSIQKIISEDVAKVGEKITNRYSPGYCEWHLSEQHKLFSLLPDGFCGVSLTESALMLPIKSISGMIGIGKNVKMAKYACAICSDLNCIRRNC